MTGSSSSAVQMVLRIAAGTVVAIAFAFLLNNYLNFWWSWPSALAMTADLGWFGMTPPETSIGAIHLGQLQVLSYALAPLLVAAYVAVTRHRSMRDDAGLLTALAAYIVRSAFWSVLLIGLADMLISFLRVEDLLESLAGAVLTQELGRSVYRGTHVHYPLIVLSMVIALFVRGLGFIWLAFLVVLAEFQIVISRFVFSYEQAFMGDLVRFWYAALFLFASAYALVDEGHVRVDVFYARFSARGKAWANLLGSVFLGFPLCWVILTTGMWGRGSSISSPLLSFEISQSGFGMYVKYLMAGFLVIFSLSMILQFAAYVLSSAATICDKTVIDDVD